MTKSRVARGSRERRAERGWRPPVHGGDVRVALAYPGDYRAGMSSLGFQVVAQGFAALPGVLVERVFLDEGGLETLDAGFDPGRADLLAFSISGENDYEGVLGILARAGLPLRAAARGRGAPLVAAGGFAPTLNPEPLAPFVDVVALGEGEELLAPLADAAREFRSDPAGALRRLAVLDGFYVPSLYEPRYAADGTLAAFEAAAGAPVRVRRASVADLDARPAIGRTVAPGTQFEELCMVEVNRGCARACRFCAGGSVVRPLRHRSLDALRASIAATAGLHPRVGLLGAAVADHPDLLTLARELGAAGRGFSLSSLRIEGTPPELLELLARGGTRTATLAPETGSERLRFAIGKRVADAQVLDAAGRAAAAGMRQVKLYFMLGLPTETPEDRAAIPALVARVRERLLEERRERTGLVRVAVSLGGFVPKAWTPFQWHPFAGVRGLREAFASVGRALGRVPNTEVAHEQPRWSYVQALLSLGDRRVAGVLEGAAHDRGGWARALRESPVAPDFFVTRGRGRDELLPWDFVDVGLAKGDLWRRYERALGRGGGAGEAP